MNKTQREIAKTQLKDEERAIKELKQAYSKARKDVESQIAALAARKDMENIQSIVYQMKYQKAMLDQIDGVLKDLNQGQYSTITDFTNGSYANGYIGSMYDLQKQGIPMTVPVDPEKMKRAVQTDSKLSRSYYQNRDLPENLTKLKKNIRSELTRGIASGKTWPEMAYQVAQGMNSPFKRAMSDAMRIVRTEGHRINQAGFLDAGDTAREKGADVLKQWDATLDDATRPEHQELDGQIVEWDEDFTVDGYSASAPGMFGDPSMDCNCRCQLLQRARWALDQDELNTLQERAEFFGLDKADSFEDFKEKFLNMDTPITASQTQMISKKQTSNAYSVDRSLVNTKQYHDKFEGLTEHKAVNESVYQETMKMLEHRDGTNLEDLKIFDARTGKMIVENLKSTKPGATGLTTEQYAMYQAHVGQKVLLHNHPNGSRPSFRDIRTMFVNDDVVASIANGHDGSVHIVSSPNRDVDIDKLWEMVYNDNKEKYKDPNVARVKALDELYDMELFSYERR